MCLAEVSPVLEISVHHPVGEALATDTNSFKYAVTGELMHHEGRVDHTCQKRHGRRNDSSATETATVSINLSECQPQFLSVKAGHQSLTELYTA